MQTKLKLGSIGLVVVLYLSSIVLQGCAGCSRQDNEVSRRNSVAPKRDSENRPTRRVSEEIEMTVNGGVYEIPVDINGSKMNFIFDTGASSICISETEARFLVKQGTLDASDVVGETQMTDANGDISAGVVVKLRTVKIGSRTLQNVEAIVVPNGKAPLLLGQTALAKFGKISIDYNKNKLIFE